MKTIPWHIITKVKKLKDTLLKATSKKRPVTLNEAAVKMTAHFSLERVETRRQWNVLKQSNCKPRMMYSVKIGNSKMKAITKRAVRRVVKESVNLELWLKV